MKAKVTMKDIAREAGVSEATVSYVLNYSTKEKISHETRLKVFDAAKRLQYVPNMAARVLAGKNPRRQIGIMLPFSIDKEIPYYLFQLLSELHARIAKFSYDAVLLSVEEALDTEQSQNRYLDGLILVGFDEETVQTITGHYYIPVILVDCYYENPLFYKVCNDYNQVFQLAKDALGDLSYLICEPIKDSSFYQTAIKYFGEEHVLLMDKGTDPTDFIQSHSHQKGLIWGELLAIQLQPMLARGQYAVMDSGLGSGLFPQGTVLLNLDNKTKAEVTITTLIHLTKLDDFTADPLLPVLAFI